MSHCRSEVEEKYPNWSFCSIWFGATLSCAKGYSQLDAQVIPAQKTMNGQRFNLGFQDAEYMLQPFELNIPSTPHLPKRSVFIGDRERVERRKNYIVNLGRLIQEGVVNWIFKINVFWVGVLGHICV